MPTTQGIKYAGSKLKLIPHILSLMDGLEIRTVLDGFSGTTRVSQAFAKSGFQVTSNDISDWSQVFATCYLKNQQPAAAYNELIAHLNAVQGADGWFSQHYGGVDYAGSAIQADGSKKPWQLHNTQKLDAIRDEIERLNLSEVEKAVALTSLIRAMDAVDNTLGHFSSYLKAWSARSYHPMMLKVPQLWVNTCAHTVLKGDIFQSIKHVDVDLAYFDPPYGSNNEKMPPSRVRYAAYYHLWSTICRHDKPDIFGAAGRRQDSSDAIAATVFEEFRKDSQGNHLAINAIDDLLHATQARYIALSYSSGGSKTAEQLYDTLKKHGHLLKTIEVDYKRNVMAAMKWTHEWLRDAKEPNKEFIFLLEK
jgi:adenine-specific DNA-methyltransferase